MRVVNCICGKRLEAEDSAEPLFSAVRAHSDAEHADLRIPDERIRQMVTAAMRMDAWDGTTRTAREVEVRALAPVLRDDFLRFFDRTAFMDNPIWADCYCLFYQFAGPQEEWAKRGADENRADKAALIERGESHGYLLYADGEPAGWCHAAPRPTLPPLGMAPEMWGNAGDAASVGSIVCFTIAAPYRRQGLATTLLDAACDGFRAQGIAVAEAYPVKRLQGAAPDAFVYHGPLSMYLAAGFERHAETERFQIVRKALR